jgi:hypothetical protein
LVLFLQDGPEILSDLVNSPRPTLSQVLTGAQFINNVPDAVAICSSLDVNRLNFFRQALIQISAGSRGSEPVKNIIVQVLQYELKVLKEGFDSITHHLLDPRHNSIHMLLAGPHFLGTDQLLALIAVLQHYDGLRPNFSLDMDAILWLITECYPGFSLRRIPLLSGVITSEILAYFTASVPDRLTSGEIAIRLCQLLNVGTGHTPPFSPWTVKQLYNEIPNLHKTIATIATLPGAIGFVRQASTGITAQETSIMVQDADTTDRHCDDGFAMDFVTFMEKDLNRRDSESDSDSSSEVKHPFKIVRLNTLELPSNDVSHNSSKQPQSETDDEYELQLLFGDDSEDDNHSTSHSSEVDDISGNSDHPPYATVSSSNLPPHNDLNVDEDNDVATDENLSLPEDLNENENNNEIVVAPHVTLPFVRFAGNFRKIRSDSDSDTD